MGRILAICLMVFSCSFVYETLAQKPQPYSHKLPAGISLAEIKAAPSVYILTATNIQIPAVVLQRITATHLLYTADPKYLNIDSLMQIPAILFMQPSREAKEEMVVNGSDLSLNSIFFAHSKYSLANGNGLTVSVKENRPDSFDIDFAQRYVTTGLESSTLSAHATTMTTLIGGAGNTYYTGKGVACKSRLTSVSFQTLLPEHDSVYKKYNVSVQNHSYGTGIENYYGADSWAYDASINNNDSLLHIFSAGNSGIQTSTAGKYAGITGFANLTGSFKQSKNSISIAATDSFYNVESLSSKGPAYDGRIKPELVAFGQDGSSGAAALVSGTALLVQDVYQQRTGTLPSSALVRAALINSADDILQPGPDYISGFGSLNTERAIRQISNEQYFVSTVTNANTQQFNISIPANVKELKVTLAWNDVAAVPNAVQSLVNDLDLEVEEVATGIIHHPLVLSHSPHIDSLNKNATQKKDTLNTIEQVVINIPAAGNYIITIKGSSVQNSQAFGVVYNWENNNGFEFTYPTKNDNLYPGSINTIRWNNTYDASTTGTLQITYDGITWHTENNTTFLTNRYFKANIKDTVTVARLRMLIGSATILSDSFTISPRIETNVGYSCPDSFQLYWNKLNGVTKYLIYGLTDTFMRPLYQTIDTFITIPTNIIQHYAIASLVASKTGLRSFTFDHTTQGIGCFINSFLADVFDDTTVNLQAVLGTTHNIRELTFQRLYPVTDVSHFQVTTDTFKTTDQLTRNGVYYYRVKLLLHSGSEVFSDTLQVRIFQNKPFILYPNPFTNGGRLIVQSKDYENSTFELLNIMGQKVFRIRLTTETEHLALPSLQKGIYFYRILQHNKQSMTGKLLVQ